MCPSVWYVGCHPIVHGWPFGSPHLVAPVATNSWGTCSSFMYFQMAVFDGVPSVWKRSSTWSCSTSFRTISTVLGGL